jgi:hypothetical protein
MLNCRRGVAIIGLCILLTTVLRADTLILRDGGRLQGMLLSVRDGVIEFESQRGGLFGGRERVRVGRDEVVRIELDEERARGGGRDDRGTDAAGRPSGMRERDVRVDARSGWVDAGVTVRQGQAVYFNATGRVRWGPGRQDGPDGERNSPRNDARPIPSRPAAALIGRIGEGDEYFFIGDSDEPIRMRASGRLSLGVNDDYLSDNSGAFDVTIAY